MSKSTSKVKSAAAKKRGQRADDLGNAAETAVRGWFSLKAGWTWDPVSRDRDGVDATCSWIARASADSPLADLTLPTYFNAVVQVKASDDLGKNRPKISLERALRLIQRPGPAFILLLDYGGTKAPIRVELVHVAGDFVKAALAAIALTDNQRINDKKISIAKEFAATLEPPYDEALARALKDAAGASPSSYFQKKIDETNRIQRETMVAGASFTFVTPGMDQDLVDFALGDRDSVRFIPSGPVVVRARGSAKSLDAVDLVFARNRRSPEVSVHVSGGGLETTFRAELFHTHSTFPQLPKERECLRLRGVLAQLDVLGPSGTGRVEIGFRPPAGPTKLLALSQEALLALLLDKAALQGSEIEISITGSDKEKIHRLSFRPGRCLPKNDQDVFIRLAVAGRLARDAGLDQDVSIVPGLLHQQHEALVLAFAIVMPEVAGAPGFLMQPNENSPVAGTSYAVPVVSRVVLGDFVVVSVGILRGALKVVPGELTFALADPVVQRLLTRAWTHLPGKKQRQELDDAADQAIAQFTEKFEGLVNARTIGAVFH